MVKVVDDGGHKCDQAVHVADGRLQVGLVQEVARRMQHVRCVHRVVICAPTQGAVGCRETSGPPALAHTRLRFEQTPRTGILAVANLDLAEKIAEAVQRQLKRRDEPVGEEQVQRQHRQGVPARDWILCAPHPPRLTHVSKRSDPRRCAVGTAMAHRDRAQRC